MFSDSDIKIAGDRPSENINKNRDTKAVTDELDKKTVASAKAWGKEVALKFIEDANESRKSEEDYLEMLIQRRLLLSFTATVGFEQRCGSDTLSGIAQKSFIDTVKSADEGIYKTASDTGAYSFYYLAFRRGGDVERRIGQTFAMLCSHDGDPIFQELGEALYCWFFSFVKNSADKFNIT